MKKLHLVSMAYAQKGHGKEYIMNFCRELNTNYKIILYVSSQTVIDVPAGIDVIYISPNKFLSNKILNNPLLKTRLKKLISQFTAYKYVKTIFAKGLIDTDDVVFMMDYSLLSLFTFFRRIKKLKAKSYLWIHSARFESKDVVYHYYKKLFKWIFNKYVSKIATGIIVNGDYIKEKVIQALNVLPQKIHVIQYPSRINFNKIDKAAARKTLDIKISENVILFFGILRKDKNIKDLIKSVAETKCNPLLIVAGSEQSVTKADIYDWIDEFNLKNYRLDIKYVSEEKMALYYSASDLLILTYILESASQSGPLSLAREFELPALVTNTGEIGYYVKQNNLGLTAELFDTNDFSNKIDYYFNLSNSENFKKHLKYAKQKYSWGNAKIKYLSLFD